MYSSLPTFVIGFHGCDKSVQRKVLSGKENLKKSENKYDWLGNGVYFWENNHERALQYAREIKKHPEKHTTIIKSPAVIGAIIHVGNCFNLLDSKYIKALRNAYEGYVEVAKSISFPVPKNEKRDKGGFPLKRNLDRAVIEYMHATNKLKPYHTVRGVFTEGEEIYPGSGFYEKSHVQICVRNPNCIKGYFLPRKEQEGFDIP
jgi:hypothetical protein